MLFTSVGFLAADSGVYIRNFRRNQTVGLCPDVFKASPFLVKPDHRFDIMATCRY